MLLNVPIVIPPVELQAKLVGAVRDAAARIASAQVARPTCCTSSANASALITACVTGEFDGTTASSRAAEAALQGVV